MYSFLYFQLFKKSLFPIFGLKKLHFSLCVAVFVSFPIKYFKGNFFLTQIKKLPFFLDCPYSNNISMKTRSSGLDSCCSEVMWPLLFRITLKSSL